MIIPAKSVVWMKKHALSGEFEACAYDVMHVAKNTVFMCQDMISDHMPEMYEDARDTLLEKMNT